MSNAVIAFLHFLAWASHYEWQAFAPDSTGNGNHVVYAGNVLDCIRTAAMQAPVHVPAGAPVPAAGVCVAA